MSTTAGAILSPPSGAAGSTTGAVLSSGGGGAPASEAPMNPSVVTETVITMVQENTLAFKSYTFSKDPFAACCSCGSKPGCTVTDTASGSVIIVMQGCSGNTMHLDGKFIANLILQGTGDGSWVRVPTLMGTDAQVLAQCYLARTSRGFSGQTVYVLKIMDSLILEAPAPSEAFQRTLTFCDSFGQVAIEFSAGGSIRAREDIPFPAVALIPYKDMNSGIN